MEIRKTFTQSLSLENSFGTLRRDNKVEIEIILRIKEFLYGSFELYDVATQGEDWYAEGGLWFEVDVSGKRELADYDGVCAISENILDMLEENGIDCSEIRELEK